TARRGPGPIGRDRALLGRRVPGRRRRPEPGAWPERVPLVQDGRVPGVSDTFVGYHASHEQFTPSRLLRLCVEAESAGFAGAMCSDRALPWREGQGGSGFAWAWRGSAWPATGPSPGSVCGPVPRHRPGIAAQALGPLAEMFPRRVWVAFGSGEHLNERVVGG